MPASATTLPNPAPRLLPPVTAVNGPNRAVRAIIDPAPALRSRLLEASSGPPARPRPDQGPFGSSGPVPRTARRGRCRKGDLGEAKCGNRRSFCGAPRRCGCLRAPATFRVGLLYTHARAHARTHARARTRTRKEPAETTAAGCAGAWSGRPPRAASESLRVSPARPAPGRSRAAVPGGPGPAWRGRRAAPA